jgi:hypothetical protein
MTPQAILSKVLARKPEGERPLGKPGHRWEDNIKMDLKGIRWENMHYSAYGIRRHLR